MRDHAALDDHGLLGQAQRHLGMLLHQHQGNALLLGHPPHRRRQFLDNDRRQTLEWLVQQQHRRVGHQRAGNGQHLLLAAR